MSLIFIEISLEGNKAEGKLLQILFFQSSCSLDNGGFFDHGIMIKMVLILVDALRWLPPYVLVHRLPHHVPRPIQGEGLLPPAGEGGRRQGCPRSTGGGEDDAKAGGAAAGRGGMGHRGRQVGGQRSKV